MCYSSLSKLFIMSAITCVPIWEKRKKLFPGLPVGNRPTLRFIITAPSFISKSAKYKSNINETERLHREAL